MLTIEDVLNEEEFISDEERTILWQQPDTQTSDEAEASKERKFF